jgi:hypothetical protein
MPIVFGCRNLECLYPALKKAQVRPAYVNDLEAPKRSSRPIGDFPVVTLRLPSQASCVGLATSLVNELHYHIQVPTIDSKRCLAHHDPIQSRLLRHICVYISRMRHPSPKLLEDLQLLESILQDNCTLTFAAFVIQFSNTPSRNHGRR